MDNQVIAETITEPPGQYRLQPEQWVELYADYLYAFALRRLEDPELARDLVQETFLAALEKADGFRGESTEKTWLTAIIKYKIIDVYKKKSRSVVTEPEQAFLFTEGDFFDQDLHHWKREHWPQLFGVEDNDPLHNKEFMSVLQRCMQRLPQLWLSVFRMKHIDEETSTVICKALRISSGNYWVIIHRAKVNLRSCLQKNWL